MAFLFIISSFKLTFFSLCWVFVALCRLSLVVVSRGYSRVAVHGLLVVVASLAAEHKLQGVQALVAVGLRLSSCDSRVLESSLSSCGSQA